MYVHVHLQEPSYRTLRCGPWCQTQIFYNKLWIQVHMHTCTHTHIHTYTHTQIHIHIYAYLYVVIHNLSFVLVFTLTYSHVQPTCKRWWTCSRACSSYRCVYILFTPVYICISMRMCLCVYICAYFHGVDDVWCHTYIHSYKHTYMHINIHTCI